MKTITQQKKQYFAYYPDIMSAYSLRDKDDYVYTNPSLIIEILSDSTERTDLKEKFDNYTTILSLLEYIVVSQGAPLVRLWRRQTVWKIERYRADDTFRLESVELDVLVQYIYRQVRKEVGRDVSR